MSLIVLKRKASTKYNSLSSRGNVGFSLNNPRRVDSHANQTQTQTPMKGNVPRGHGTCCGKYPVVINKSQYNNYDAHVREYNGPKSNTGISVKNNQSSISTRHKWMKRGYPYTSVKNMNHLDNELYLMQKKNCLHSLQSQTSNDACNVVKDVSIKSHSEYLETIKCVSE